jgi:hypothetical protein
MDALMEGFNFNSCLDSLNGYKLKKTLRSQAIMFYPFPRHFQWAKDDLIWTMFAHTNLAPKNWDSSRSSTLKLQLQLEAFKNSFLGFSKHVHSHLGTNVLVSPSLGIVCSLLPNFHFNLNRKPNARVTTMGWQKESPFFNMIFTLK